jgi:cytochrome P450
LPSLRPSSVRQPLPGATAFEPLESLVLSQGQPVSPSVSASVTQAVTSPCCPTGPSLSSSSKSLLRQARALGEGAALAATSDAGQATTAAMLGEFRQGLCPYLAQATQNQGPEWSALDVLRQNLQDDNLDPVQFLDKVHDYYGSSVQVGNVLFEARPEVVQDILTQTDNDRAQKDDFGKSTLQIQGLGSVYGDNSVFLLSDEGWKQRRELLQPFFTGEHVLSEDKHSHLVQTIHRHFDSWALGQPIDLGAKLRALTLDVAMQHMFGEELPPAELERSAALFERAGEFVTNRFLGRGEDCPSELRAELDAWADERLSGRAPGAGRNDMLQALLNSPQGQDRQALRDEILTMTMLGHETTAALLSSTAAQLSQHPEVVAQLREEYRQEVGSGAPTLKQTQALQGTKAALKESTRLHAPNYLVSREAKHDVRLETPDGPMDVRKGTQILMALQEVNQDEAYWGPSGPPEEWIADRDGARLYSFGGGGRVCLGQVLARLESNLVLSQMVERFELQAVAPQPAAPLSDFSSRPSDMRFVLHKRNPS